MGIIRHEASGRRVTLSTRSMVGRVDTSAIRLESLRSSAEHAVLFWDGARWSVRDLGSTNGTQVDGRCLPVNERAMLEAGAALMFGDETERWTLEEAGPPGASALHDSTLEVRRAEDGLLALPDASDPQVTLSEDSRGCWTIELDGVVRLAVDQERVDAGGPWTIRVPEARGEHLPTTTVGARPPMLVGATLLRFEVSRDGEHIDLSVVHDGQVTSLGSRAHHELLLELARARLRDKRVGIPAAEQGWLYVDALLRMLKLELHHLNINVFRARKQLARAGMLDTGSLVERRATTRQIRLGTDVIDIIQL